MTRRSRTCLQDFYVHLRSLAIFIYFLAEASAAASLPGAALSLRCASSAIAGVGRSFNRFFSMSYQNGAPRLSRAQDTITPSKLC